MLVDNINLPVLPILNGKIETGRGDHLYLHHPRCGLLKHDGDEGTASVHHGLLCLQFYTVTAAGAVAKEEGDDALFREVDLQVAKVFGEFRRLMKPAPTCPRALQLAMQGVVKRAQRYLL